jgi:hypothetical protein
MIHIIAKCDSTEPSLEILQDIKQQMDAQKTDERDSFATFLCWHLFQLVFSPWMFREGFLDDFRKFAVSTSNMRGFSKRLHI